MQHKGFFNCIAGYALLLVTLLIPVMSSAQQEEDTLRNPLYGLDFFRINAAFSELKQTAVTIHYRIYNDDRKSSIIDSSHSEYFVHEGMMYGEMDGVRLLRNRSYSLSVNLEDSLVAISRIVQGAGPLQINMLDSLFRATNVAGFDREAMADGKTRLSVLFKPGTFYKRYAVVYSSGYKLETITLEYLNTDYDDNGLPPAAGSTRLMEVSYGAYRPSSFDLGVFNEGNYVQRDEYGKWVGTGIYHGWQVITSEQGL